MLVEDVRIELLDRDRIEVRATCGGRPLFYRLPASRYCPQSLGDALVVSVLAPAMLAGTAVRLPANLPVSSVLAANLDGIQRIWSSWNGRLRKVPLEAERYDPAPAAAGGVGLFYAGGVDSSYSLIAHLAEVDLLMIVFGFEYAMTESEAAENLARNGRFARMLGKELVLIETNHSRFVADHGVSRTMIFGATLSAIGQLLGLRRCYIASSHSAANPRPEGSYPVLDPRFSNGITEIVHDDVSVTRVEKTWAVAARPEFLDNLRVCWELPNENCGGCGKCLRTMAALRLCGARGPFPPLDDMRRLRWMAAHSDVEYVVSMLVAAHERGDVVVERELRKGLRRNDFNNALRYLDQALFRGGLRRLRRRYRDAERTLAKIELRPDLDL